MDYQTKVMKPSNLKGMSAAKEAIEAAITEAEKNQMTGEVSVTVTMKDGGSCQVQTQTNKTIRLPS